ncbi:MAG: MATE family efflux transporter [Pseudomonadales bacterium]
MESARLQRILNLGLPIMGGMISQSVLNLVDTAMVGALNDPNALASVGIGSFVNFISIALIMSLGISVQAMVARRMGENRQDVAAHPLNSGIVLALLVGLPLTLICLHYSPYILRIFSDNPDVIRTGTEYYNYRVLGIIAVGLNFSFRGYWNGIDRSIIYLKTILLVHLSNIILSYGLIYGKFGFSEMGAVGAGVGTTVSLYLGAAMLLFITLRQGGVHGFAREFPSMDTFRSLLKLAVPNSLQQLLFALGVTTFFWIISQIGLNELAISHVLINLSLALILPGMGLGQASTTLVSQALGKRNYDDAHQWAWDVVKVALVLLLLMASPMLLIPDATLSLFVSTPALIDLGHYALQIIGLCVLFDSIVLVLSQSLLGAGDSKNVFKVTVSVQWLFTLPLAWLFGPVLGFGLAGAWCAQFLQRVVATTIYIRLWNQRKWTSIKI